MQIISPSGGALNLLYKLEISRESGVGSAGSADGATLGKLDIRWRTPLGDLGRLQTQPIVALAAAAKEVVLQVKVPHFRNSYVLPLVAEEACSFSGIVFLELHIIKLREGLFLESC